MYTYYLLRNPGHNRVYFSQSQKLSLSELKIASQCFDSECKNIQNLIVSGVEYIMFESVKEITQKDLKIISRLSFVYAMFEAVKDRETILFSPIAIEKNEYMDGKITTILKYSGKTNETFTRMMINIALFSSEFRNGQSIELLDPVAGKGTTLFAGLVYGFNVSGIDIRKDSVHEACVFFKKNLELERYKHTFSKNKYFGSDKEISSSIHKFEFAPNKEEFKNIETRKKLTFVAGNSIYADKFLKRDSYHIIVGDLPYGVAHGNRTQKKQTSHTRNPSKFLTACLPAWFKVLKKKGVIVLAFNSFVLSRDGVSGLLQKNGFTVLTGSPYDEFEHRVDRSIKRDIVVAKK